MRVPILVVALLCPIAIATTWWLGTRTKDFMTPPPGLVLPVIPPTIEPPPVPHQPTPLADDQPVTLDTFADQAAMGPSHLIQLAHGLEEAKFNHLAWLAWERVLDSTSASPQEITQARNAIRRLRSTSSSETIQFPPHPLSITLQAGTARKHVTAIQPLLEQTARQIESASSGILRVRALVTGGSDPTQPDTHGPVAIWISGSDSGSRSSEVLSFTLQPNIPAQQRIESATSELLRNLVARSLTPPPPPPNDMPFPEELADHFTRRAWFSIGSYLNLPVEENP